jgi:hypothetical protein
MDMDAIKNLGPLAALAGVWEGDKGDDVAPSDDRGTENNKFRERIRFEPFGPVDNHEQQLWGLRYAKTAWRLGEADSFHEETGYWLWDPKERQAMCCFIVPRGVAVIAGGTVAPDAKSFTLSASVGSPTYGVCSNLFLDREFQTVRFDLTVTINADGSFSYAEDTQLKMPQQADVFHHRDQNTLRRVSDA